METKQKSNDVACECGEWSGKRCDWIGPAYDTEIVECMPRQYRASHTTAGNRGTHPQNGAKRIRVYAWECAALMIKVDGDWCSIVQENEKGA